MNTTTDVTWNRLRQLVKRKTGSKCFHCGILDDNGHCDHLIPLSKGGTDSILNLVWSCEKCNLKKKDKLDDFDDTLYDNKNLNNGEIYPDFRKLLRAFVSMIIQNIIPPYPTFAYSFYPDYDEYQFEIIRMRRQKIREWIRQQIWPVPPDVEMMIAIDKFNKRSNKALKNYPQLLNDMPDWLVNYSFENTD